MYVDEKEGGVRAKRRLTLSCDADVTMNGEHVQTEGEKNQKMTMDRKIDFLRTKRRRPSIITAVENSSAVSLVSEDLRYNNSIILQLL